MKAKKIIGNLLMAFLLVSIGVAIGKEMAGRNLRSAPAPSVAPGQEKVMVYYMHGIPCVTCTLVETTAETLVEDEFAEAVDAGRMAFVSVNYLEPEHAELADRYHVGSNMVVAVRFRGDGEVERVRLDRVMELAGRAEVLKEYLRQGIRSVLEGGDE